MSVETKQNKTYDKLVGTKRKGIALLFVYLIYELLNSSKIQ